MAIAVLGMQWGDEGKGKIVHLLARDADIVVRFNGGANAGHTLIDRGVKFGTHLIPAGAFYPGTLSVLSSGMVIDLSVLREEFDAISRHIGTRPELLIAENAHLVLPYHPIVEDLEGSVDRIGTTRRGIGPAYRDKAARVGIRAGDLLEPELLRKRVDRRIELLKRAWPGVPEVAALDPGKIADRLLQVAAPFLSSIGDAACAIREGLARGEEVLFEGAQGALLDLDYGTYPYVTSSSTTFSGLRSAVGIPTAEVAERIGVVKAYSTRVGAGPFPTELEDEVGGLIQDRGGEYGVTTGRPRRCGWLDLVALRYAVSLNDPTAIALTKLDVLTGIDELKVCVAYRLGGRTIEHFPRSAADLERSVPVYESVPGWSEPIAGARSFDRLPGAARAYVELIADACGAPARLISVGPAPEETIRRL